MEERVRAWGVNVESIVETESSVLALGQRDQRPVVVKVIRRTGDEWFSGAVLKAFNGKGVVQVLDYVDGAVLLERLRPGRSLFDVGGVADEEATEILADVIGRMSPATPPETAPTVEAWSDGFRRYSARGTEEIPAALIEAARRMYAELCGSQSSVRLLHGDLHHHNVLLDIQRGWLAVDPKGVVGELAYEVGAALRNPIERPVMFTDPATIERRVAHFAGVLGLRTERVLGWTFAQAILAAIWEVEDAGVLRTGVGFLALANAIRPMLGARDGKTCPTRLPWVGRTTIFTNSSCAIREPARAPESVLPTMKCPVSNRAQANSRMARRARC
jgi:streptomycin 6-kinase